MSIHLYTKFTLMKMPHPSAAPAGADMAMLQAEAAFEHLRQNFIRKFIISVYRLVGSGIDRGFGALGLSMGREPG